MADDFSDLATRQQVALERIKAGFDRDFRGILPGLRAKIREVFSKLEVETMDELSLRQLNKFLVELSKAQEAITGAYMGDFEKELSKVAKFSSEMEVSQLASLDTGDLPAIALTSPAASSLYKAALRQPIQATGTMLEPFIRDWPEQDTARINKVIRTGYAQGRTTQEMVREIVGTGKEGFKDGQTEVTRRNASAVTHTATQHVATTARIETWQTDKELGLGYYLVATLDRKTTTQCRGLETLHGVGKTPLVYGEGPLPPIHVKCRTSVVPEVAGPYKELQEGGTRPAVVNKDVSQVPATEVGYDWLKRQPKEFQEFAIGRDRTKLLNDGGLTERQFADLSLDKNFEPLTLEEMKTQNPEAFKKAGVKQ